MDTEVKTAAADIAALIENTRELQQAVASEQAAYEEKLKRREARDADESKMFRRFKGMTPTEYRNSHSDKEV